MKKSILYLSIISLFLFISCKKNKQEDWLIVDATISNFHSGEIEDASLWIQFTYEIKIGPTPENRKGIISLGETVNGKFYKNVDLNHEYLKDKHALKLVIKADNNFLVSHLDEFNKSYVQKDIYRGKKNTYDIKLKQYILYYTPSFNNVSCFNSSDTLWFNKSYSLDSLQKEGVKTLRYYGCTVPEFEEDIINNFGKDVYFRFITKRDGILDTLIVHKTLEYNTVSMFSIDF